VKILLAYLCQYSDRKDYYLSLMPYGLLSIASYLEHKGEEVVLSNLSSMGYKRGASFISDEKPDVVGVSIFSFNRVDSFRPVSYTHLRAHET